MKPCVSWPSSTEMFTFHMGTNKYAVITGYEAVKEALVNQAEDFGVRGITPIFHAFSNSNSDPCSTGSLL
ncbi:cytochrome P450 2K1-like [Arapaima gigas]